MTEKAPIENYPHPKTIDTVESLLNGKSKFILAIWLFYICVVFFLHFIIRYDNLTFYAGIALFIPIFFISYKKASFTKKDYYAIPNSKDKEDMHHCVYCGSNKISTSEFLISKIHRCSQCKEFLYM